MTYWGTKLETKEVKIGHLCRGNYKGECSFGELDITYQVKDEGDQFSKDGKIMLEKQGSHGLWCNCGGNRSALNGRWCCLSNQVAGNNNLLKLEYQFEATEADAVVAVLLISLTKACVVQWGVFNLVINSELDYCPVCQQVFIDEQKLNASCWNKACTFAYNRPGQAIGYLGLVPEHLEGAYQKPHVRFPDIVHSIALQRAGTGKTEEWRSMGMRISKVVLDLGMFLRPQDQKTVAFLLLAWG
ncbi:hypothetical protein HGM15179_010347 [Zosterops borbonicus]|uniref:Uncharacterized protein n=1 Tax=Zosterops borbonicus TaxID=364589 RepID=A0A8K1GE49_9PASS|nr:hypothetical protein HGM15179_010347 [Zosterops borbonicus]